MTPVECHLQAARINSVLGSLVGAAPKAVPPALHSAWSNGSESNIKGHSSPPCQLEYCSLGESRPYNSIGSRSIQKVSLEGYTP
jgi:hypothetical protein